MKRKLLSLMPLSLALAAPVTQAAVSLDRTRVIFTGEANSMSLTIHNNNKQLPYLAQAWLEDEQGKKSNHYFTVLPPVQRLEPGMQSQLKIQALPAVAQLPKDKESLLYFNLREIPPRSDKANSLQLALQTRVKFFYRPAGLEAVPDESKQPWQEKVTLQQEGEHYRLHNPTPYYITLVEAASSAKGKPVAGFTSMMLPPRDGGVVNLSVKQLGKNPTFTYVDDYGGQRTISFSCAAVCRLIQPPRNGQ